MERRLDVDLGDQGVCGLGHGILVVSVPSWRYADVLGFQVQIGLDFYS
jgi:hypothetical protein